MGRELPEIDDKLRSWLISQPMYFVATAPDDHDDHINLSPKGGMGTFAVVDAHTVAYLDMTGSGIETIAHLRQNGRISLMFCAFEGPPKVIRLYGSGRFTTPADPDWADLRAHFNPSDEIDSLVRAIVIVQVELIRDSCGFVVPRMQLVAERDQLFRWADARQEQLGDGWDDRYRWTNNRTSIDGIPALEIGDEHGDESGRLSSSGRVL